MELKKIGIILAIITLMSVGYLNRGLLLPDLGVTSDQTADVTETEIEHSVFNAAVNDSDDDDITELEAEIDRLNQVIDECDNQTRVLEEQVTSLNEEKQRLESETRALKEKLEAAQVQSYQYLDTIKDLEKQITGLQDEVEQLESEATSLEDEITRLNHQRVSLEAQITEMEAVIDSQKTEILELESEKDRILDIVVTQHYEYVYGGWLWKDRYQWDLDIPLSLYWTYLDKPRPSHTSQWVDMANDPADDRYIDAMVRQINSAAIEEGFTESEKVEFVVAFVQSLPYTEDRVSTPWNEYPRYPIETLFDRGGDCEDTSILVAALLDCMGYDTALLLLYKESHAAVGVSISGVSGSYYTVDGQRYYYLETTGEGFDIGKIPSDFTETSAYVYPLNP